jgi:hypothetical protein
MAGLVAAIHALLCRQDVDDRDIGERIDAVLRTAMRGHDAGVRGSRLRNFQIHFFKQPRSTDMIHRPCCLVGAGCALVFLPLTHVRERSAGTARVTTGHLTKAPACRVTGTRASRRSTAAILGAVTVLLRADRRDFPSRYPGSIGAALHPIASSH